MRVVKRSVMLGASLAALGGCAVGTEDPSEDEALGQAASAMDCWDCDYWYQVELLWCVENYKPGDSVEDNVAFAGCNDAAWRHLHDCLNTCEAPSGPPPGLPQCISTSECISWYGVGWQCNAHGSCESVSSTIELPMCKGVGEACSQGFECCGNYCDWWAGTCGS